MAVEPTAPEVEDIDPAEALAEGGTGPGATKPEGTKADANGDSEEKDVIDILVPKKETKKWKFSDGDIAREYVQRPLSYFGKMQWFSLVGEVIDKAVSGEDGLRISNLFEVPGGGDFTSSDFRDADTFIQAVGKLLVYAPDFLEKSYAIWLGIPDFERDWAITVMSRPPEDGGLTDDDGIEIVEIFIDQNWEALESFFRDKIGTLRDRVQARRKEAAESRQSKP